MSSNAFARSRPRVRQQRVHRITSCEHPRFMQLVNELARINEAKKKQQEEPYANNSTSCCETNSNSNTVSPISTIPVASGATSSGQAILSGGGCCNSTGPQGYSTGYRSLDIDQSTSAMNDNYTQIQHNHNIHHHGHQDHHNNHPRNVHPHHNHNQQQLPQQAHHHHSNQQLSHSHQSPQFSSNNNLQQQQQQQDDRCPVKASSTNFGYSKQNLVELNNSPEFSNNSSASNTTNGISDLRQDENRSKRKRSTSEYPASNKKNSSSSSCGSSGSSKRHKSSSDSIRPLSPSFTKCPICLLDTMDRDPSFTNTCFHLFCFVCIENWSKNKVTCPLCRTKFTKIIYNIKSATSFEEKATYPIRRDDDDNYISDRLMLDHLSTLSSTSASSRNTGNTNTNGGNSDDVQFLFDNLRNTEVLAMPSYFVSQMDSRGPGEHTLHSFNPVTASASFNSNVPHPSFSANFPIASNYIALFPQSNIPPTSTAIAHAYNSNTSINHLINDPNSRRISRSGRYLNSRNPDHPSVDYHPRTSSRPTTSMSQDGMPMDRMPAHSQSHHHANPLQHHNQHQDHHHHHHHHQHQHQHQIQHSHQQHHHHAHLHHPSGSQTQQSHIAPPQQSQPPPPPQLQHQPPIDQHRSPIEMSARQVQRLEQVHNNIPLSYSIPPRGLNQPIYMRRQYNNPHAEHPLMNNLYRNIPDF